MILIWDFTYSRAVVYAAMIYVLWDTMNQHTCTKRGNIVVIKEMNIFNRKLESSYVENLSKIPDSVMQLLEGELHNSDNILYYYSQVNSLTIPMLEQLLKKNELTRYKRDIYNLYFAITKETLQRFSIRECQKAEMYFKLINKLYKKHRPNHRKSLLSYNFVLQQVLLVLGKVDYSRLIINELINSLLRVNVDKTK